MTFHRNRGKIVNEKDFEERLLGELEEDLAEYDKIFLVSGRGRILDELVNELCGGKEAKNQKKKILALSSVKRQSREEASVTYRQITEEEEEWLGRFYLTYEFSDRFLLLSEQDSYGSLLRLVETGLLGMAQAVEALLY